MWLKTLLGLPVALLLTINGLTVINRIVPASVQFELFFSYVFGFVIWAAITSFFYCSAEIKKPLLYTLPPLVVFGGVNTMYLTGLLS